MSLEQGNAVAHTTEYWNGPRDGKIKIFLHLLDRTEMGNPAKTDGQLTLELYTVIFCGPDTAFSHCRKPKFIK